MTEAELRGRIAAGSRAGADYLALAKLLKTTLRFEEAAEIYKQGLRHDVSTAEKARLAWELGALLDKVMCRTEEAATLAEEALGLLTDEPDTADSELLRGLSHSLLAHALWFRDEQAGASAAREAIRLLEQLISTHREHPDIGSAFVEIAWAHTSLGHHHRAIELCREHLRAEQDPGYRLQSLITMAEALRNIGRLREAEDTLTQALECSHADPLTRPLLYVTQGLIRQGMQQPASALESFERALHALRDHPLEVRDQEILKTIYGNLAELHYANANLREAIGALKQLLIQYNDDGEDRHRILNWLGTCQATIGAAGEARRCFEEVLASPLVNDVEKTEAKDGLTRLTRPKGRM